MLTEVFISAIVPHEGEGVARASFTRAEVLSELDRISRTALQKKKALQKMLRFVVEATLDERTAFLKEYTIATLVFGKGDNFDPRMTSLVRTQAHKLREALAAHYRSDPNFNGPWLWMPAGSYRAVFHYNPGLNPRGSRRGRVSSRFRVAEPIILSRGSDLRAVADAVASFHREHPEWRKAFAAGPKTAAAGRHPMAPSDYELKHTIVEVDDMLLVTAYLLEGDGQAVLFGRSFSVGWTGDANAAIAHIAPQLSLFVSECCGLLGEQFLRVPDAVQ